MRLIIFVFLSIVPVLTFADSLEVKGSDFEYSLRYEKTFVNFKQGTYSKSWKVKPCGDWAYKNHFAVLRSKAKKEFLRLPAGAKNSVKVTLDRKPYYFPAESGFARELKNFPANFSSLKAQEVMACSK